jgi:hypothetical protein
MDAWSPKHVEDQDTTKWLWKFMCIKLVTLQWYAVEITKLMEYVDSKEDPPI